MDVFYSATSSKSLGQAQQDKLQKEQSLAEYEKDRKVSARLIQKVNDLITPNIATVASLLC